jgi:hypothetical protein
MSAKADLKMALKDLQYKKSRLAIVENLNFGGGENLYDDQIEFDIENRIH